MRARSTVHALPRQTPTRPCVCSVLVSECVCVPQTAFYRFVNTKKERNGKSNHRRWYECTLADTERQQQQRKIRVFVSTECTTQRLWGSGDKGNNNKWLTVWDKHRLDAAAIFIFRSFVRSFTSFASPSSSSSSSSFYCSKCRSRHKSEWVINIENCRWLCFYFVN